MTAAAIAMMMLVAGTTLLYLATPHQALRASPLGRWASRAGLAALAVALILLLRVMGPATAVFAWTTGLMLLWTIPPLAIAFARRRTMP